MLIIPPSESKTPLFTILYNIKRVFSSNAFSYCKKEINVIRCNINPSTTNVPHPIESNQLIYIANQLTGFYMMGNIGR